MIHAPAPNLRGLIRRVAKLLTPPPRLEISDWADAYAYIPREGNAEAGKFHCSRMPWQRDMLNDPLDPAVEETYWQMGKQVGKTLCIIIIVEYYIDQEPSAILVVYPTVDSAKAWSREKLTPTITATPRLKGKLKPSRSRDGDNTMLNKKFPGGNITITGANSPSGLRQRSKRIILIDEMDTFEANSEGDPVEQADGRSETFHNAVKLKSSTPTLRGLSRVEAGYDASDKQKFFVPCPRCGHMQELVWEQVKWTWDMPDGTQRSDPSAAVYVCAHPACKAELSDAERIAAINDPRAGWKATAPFNGVRGRHLNSIYRIIGKKKAFKTYLHEFVSGFLKAKRGGKAKLMVWENTFLAKTWEEDAEKISDNLLMQRRESYGPEIPDGVLLLVCTVDVQGDRLELEVDGYGFGHESWGICYRTIPGNPKLDKVWHELHEFLMASRWKNRFGVEFAIEAGGIDSSDGGTQDEVLKFCKPRFGMRIFALKGSNVNAAPIVSAARRGNRRRCPQFFVGTIAAKDRIFGQLGMERPATGQPSAGFMHYTDRPEAGFDAGYFSGLTAEEAHTVYHKGFPRREYHKTRPRNEPLDLRVMGLAVIGILNPNYEALAARIAKANEAAKPEKVEPPKGEEQAPKTTISARPKKSGGYIRNWR